MKRRVITLQIEIVDSEEAQWIWDNHRYVNHLHGIDVLVIQEGAIGKENG